MRELGIGIYNLAYTQKLKTTFILLSNYFFIIERRSSKSKCECGQGKKGQDPKSFAQSRRFRRLPSNVTRIVNGYEPRHRPWMTFIQIRLNHFDRFTCGGSIINSHWILSAGHCFCEKLKCKASKEGKLKIAYKPSLHIAIITGLKDIEEINSKKLHQISTPQKIIIHPL